MILNLDIRKCAVILTKYRRGEKFSPLLMQVFTGQMLVF